jgi:hypothetical protein
MEHDISDIPYGMKEIFEDQSACIIPESQKNALRKAEKHAK